MNHSILTRMEDLPVEILMEIFDYFTANEIYHSFSQLNNRLNSILKSLPTLILTTKNPLDPVLCFFHSFRGIYVKICHSKLYLSCKPCFIEGGSRLFEIYPVLDYDWYPDSLNEIEKLIHPDICSRLRSILLPTSPTRLVQLIFNGGLPHLEICHLGTCAPNCLPLSTTIQLQGLRQLTIRRQEGVEFKKILSICPSLVYLDFSCDDVISPLTFTTHCFSSVKYLRLIRLKDFLFHNGQFDFLLSLFPNLYQFHLTVNQCHHPYEIIEFNKLANCLLHRLPSLKILDLRIYTTKRMRYSLDQVSFAMVAQIHPLFKYIKQCLVLLMINSYGFNPNYGCIRQYARPSSK